jgi:hypothetical protein
LFDDFLGCGCWISDLLLILPGKFTRKITLTVGDKNLGATSLWLLSSIENNHKAVTPRYCEKSEYFSIHYSAVTNSVLPFVRFRVMAL